MKTHFKRLNLQTVFILIVPFMFMSCEKSVEKIIYPKPSENPVVLTAEAQTKDVWVKHMDAILSENQDKVISFFSYPFPQATIENDWITITVGGDLPKGVIRMAAKENATGISRNYNLITRHRGFKTIVTIIQSGK